MKEYVLKNNSCLLFLCGEKRRDTIQVALGEKYCEEVVVYKTQSVENLQLDEKEEAGVDYAVFFSPSGISAVLQSKKILEQLRRCRMIAIGKGNYRSTSLGCVIPYVP